MPKHTTRQGPNVWVVHRGGRFSIKEEGSCGYLIPPVPQRLAIGIARVIARANRSELIVQGERDQYGPQDELHTWFARIPEPKALTVVPAAKKRRPPPADGLPKL